MTQTPTITTAQNQKEDAFSKYSNDATRLRRLLLKDDDSSSSGKDPSFNLRDFAQRNYVSTSTQMKLSSEDPQDDIVNPRKTRISFEVHPSLIMDNMLEDLYNMGDMLDEDEDDDIMLDLLSFLGTRGQGTDDIMDTQSLAQWILLGMRIEKKDRLATSQIHMRGQL